jgi:hypothetical protein
VDSPLRFYFRRPRIDLDGRGVSESLANSRHRTLILVAVALIWLTSHLILDTGFQPEQITRAVDAGSAAFVVFMGLS